jgi:hypothetical protein
MTSREFYTRIVEMGISDEITEFAKSALEKLDGRNEKRSTSNATKKAEEYAPLIKLAIETVKNGKHLASEVAETLNCNTSKAVAVLTKAVEQGQMKVTIQSVKGKGKRNYYYIE